MRARRKYVVQFLQLMHLPIVSGDVVWVRVRGSNFAKLGVKSQKWPKTATVWYV
jgi:hypothetical protein